MCENVAAHVGVKSNGYVLIGPLAGAGSSQRRKHLRHCCMQRSPPVLFEVGAFVCTQYPGGANRMQFEIWQQSAV